MSHIWVDADACPVAVKDMLFRAADRAQMNLTLVANQFLRVPRSPYIRMLQVPRGFDVADDEIVQRVSAGQLVITSDIPLASLVIGRQANVLTPRGERLSADNIAALLTMRDFMDTLRASGVDTGGPPAFGAADRKQFAGELDKWLALQRKSASGGGRGSQA